MPDWSVELYAEADGVVPVEEFLRDSDLTPGELKQIRTRLDYLRQSGLSLITQRADILESLGDADGIYSLRCPNTPNNPRILLCAVFERRFVLLHGFKEQNAADYGPAIQVALKRKRRVDLLEKAKRDAAAQVTAQPKKKGKRS